MSYDSVVIEICEALLYKVIMHVHMQYQIYTLKMESYHIGSQINAQYQYILIIIKTITASSE